jgi:hypothetical protein
MVDAVREKACDIDPHAHEYAFGTYLAPAGDSAPLRYGSLNRHFDMPTGAPVF